MELGRKKTKSGPRRNLESGDKKTKYDMMKAEIKKKSVIKALV